MGGNSLTHRRLGNQALGSTSRMRKRAFYRSFGGASEEKRTRGFPAAEYESMPGTGHFLILEKPEECNQQKF